MSTLSRPLDDLTPHDVVTTDAAGRPALLGSQCAACAGLAFPARAVCYRCGGRETRTVPLESTGLVYSWTTVLVSATRAVPYSVGYVDLPGLRVFGRLDGDAPYRIGEQVEVRLDEPAADGEQPWSFRRVVQP